MIDARGYSCPMPVVMVQNEVKKNAPDTLDVLVDSQTCVENVRSRATPCPARVRAGTSA